MTPKLHRVLVGTFLAASCALSCRDIRAHKKKVKKAVAKKNRDLADRLLNRQPKYTLNRLILERSMSQNFFCASFVLCGIVL